MIDIYPLPLKILYICEHAEKGLLLKESTNNEYFIIQ